MKKLIFILICFLFASCSSFYSRDDEVWLSELEKDTRVMVKDVTVEKRHLSVKQKVRLKAVHNQDCIRIYAFPAETDPLKADMVLLVYMFTDDFPEDSFSRETVEEKINEFAVIKNKK